MFKIFRETDSIADNRARSEQLGDEAVAALADLAPVTRGESDRRELFRYVIERDR